MNASIAIGCLLGALNAGETTPQSAESEYVGCSAACVYLLLHERGDPVALADLVERLPKRAEGNAVADLVATAAEYGVRTEVRDAKEDARLPDRCFIAYFLPGGEPESSVGHFRFVRPIDLRGRQYQVLDPPEVPRIIEERELLDDPTFHGCVIVPAPWFTRTRIVAVSLLSLGALVWLRRSRSAH